MTRTILILNGPNLNLLGQREPVIYGSATLADVEKLCHGTAKRLGLVADCRQSNHEGILIDWVHEARGAAAGLIVNAGGLSHTSVALLDAVLAFEKPVVEVHISNIFKREDFRHHSWISGAAKGVICGLGIKGYELALEAMAELVKQ